MVFTNFPDSQTLRCNKTPARAFIYWYFVFGVPLWYWSLILLLSDLTVCAKLLYGTIFARKLLVLWITLSCTCTACHERVCTCSPDSVLSRRQAQLYSLMLRMQRRNWSNRVVSRCETHETTVLYIESTCFRRENTCSGRKRATRPASNTFASVLMCPKKPPIHVFILIFFSR